MNHRIGTYDAISVRIEDGQAFMGITNGARWNGVTHYFIDGWCWDKVITPENDNEK